MNKLMEFGKRVMFVVRLLSGYEERRIRAYRMQLQQRIEEAQARKSELRRLPEQAILSEVRRMVEQMQELNRRLEETEAAIEEYFKPIDKNAEIIMNMQLEKEEKQMKEMVKAMQEHANTRNEIERKRVIDNADASHNQEGSTSSQNPNKHQNK